MTPSTLSPDHAERLLKLLLRVGGTLTGLALFAVFLPTDRMAAVHSALGLGEFPATPLVDYLTRTVSALYAFHGAVLWVASFDVERSAPLIRLLGWGNIAFGGLLTGIQLHAGLPGWWIASEGPWVVASGVALLVLLRVARRRG